MAMAMVVSDDQGDLNGIRTTYGSKTMRDELMCFAFVAARSFFFPSLRNISFRVSCAYTRAVAFLQAHHEPAMKSIQERESLLAGIHAHA